MKIRTLAAALAFTVGAALAAPAVAEAGHRHSRNCRHGYRSSSHGYRSSSHGYQSSNYGYRSSSYGYRSNYDYGYRYQPSYRYEPSYRYQPSYDPYYSNDYGYYDRGPRVGYRYRRVWYPQPRVYVHHHGSRRCSRSHVNVRFGW